MGVGGEKKPFHEIAETRAAVRDDAFERIIDRIKSEGYEIAQDETMPLYIDIGEQEHEIGTQRIVEFNKDKMDIQIIRKVETHILQGASRQKHVEPLDTPRITISMKQKSQYSEDWQSVDLEDMF